MKNRFAKLFGLSAFALISLGFVHEASAASCNGPAVPNYQSGTSYSVQSSDKCKWIVFQNSGAITTTLPTPSQAISPDFSTTLVATGNGTITISSDSGATINGASVPIVLSPGSGATITVVDGNWIVLAQPISSSTTTLGNATVGALPTLAAKSHVSVIYAINYPGTVCDGVANDTVGIQSALTAVPSGGATVILPTGCRIGQLTIAKDNTSLLAPQVTLGVGLSAGDTAITVQANHVNVIMTATAAVRVIAINAVPSGAPLTDIKCSDSSFTNFFYACEATGTSSFHVSRFAVVNSIANAPSGQNAGAFLATYTDDVSYLNNRVIGGQNTSVYGGTHVTGFRAIDNYQSGLTDLIAGAEACIQVEDSAIAASDGVISGNTCVDGDIWVSDSQNIQIGPNTARRLRLSVTGVNASDVNRITATGGTYGQIAVEHYGGTSTTQRISANISNLNLDPARYSIFGTPIVASYSLDGRFIGKLSMHNISNISDASTRSASIIRDSTAKLYFNEIDFGAEPSVVSGSGGIVNERGSVNPIYTAGNGYISAYSASNFTPTTAAWTKYNPDTLTIDRNGEWSAGVFTATEAGFYNFSCSLAVTPDLTGDQFGLRLTKSGTELARFGMLVTPNTNFEVLPCRSYVTQLAAGDAVQFEYFVTGTTPTVLGGLALSGVNISRVNEAP